MKPVLSLILILCIFSHANGQILALATQPKKALDLNSLANSEKAKKKSKPTVLGVVSGCSIIAGAGLYAYGYTKIQKENNHSFLVQPDQSQIQSGHNIEMCGIVLIVLGIGMAVSDAIDKHSHHGPKVSFIAPKSAEMGLAYRF